jgi:hypothetical protein
VKRAFAGMGGKEEDAPIADLFSAALRPPHTTDNGRSISSSD